MKSFTKITTIVIFVIFGLFIVLSIFSGLIGSNSTVVPGSQPAPISAPR